MSAKSVSFLTRMWAARRAAQCHKPLLVLCRNSHTAVDKKPYYVTTPIFYPNAGTLTCILPSLNQIPDFSSAPHVGHLHTLVTGDIFARYNRIAHPTKLVHYLTGTDEHGLKIQKAAAAAGKPPREFCDELSERFKVCPLGYHLHCRNDYDNL